MRKLLLLAIILVGLGGLAADRRSTNTDSPAASEDGLSVYFSPKGGCENAVVQQLNATKKTIDLQAYTFTNLAIAKAVGEAQERGVKVRAILDKKESGSKYSSATYLADHGVETYLDGKHPIAHNKIIIIDGQTVITGSFNFTQQAEDGNAENLLIITGKQKLAAAYEKNFDEHLAHSQKYQGVK